MLTEKFDYTGKKEKLELFDKIYEKMKTKKNYDITNYFNDNLWDAYQSACQDVMKKFCDDKTITMDVLRKEGDLKTFIDAYDEYVKRTKLQTKGKFTPKIII